MDNNTLLVLANPSEPQLAMLEELPEETHLAVGNRREAFDRMAVNANIIFNGTQYISCNACAFGTSTLNLSQILTLDTGITYAVEMQAFLPAYNMVKQAHLSTPCLRCP